MYENLYRYCTVAGDGSGSKDFIGDYSITPVYPKITNNTAGKIQLHRMVVMLEDAPGMTADEYGNLGAELTNGVTFAVWRKGVLAHDFGGIHIHHNAEWGEICYDVDIKSWGNTPSNDVLLVRWTFARSGEPIRLGVGDEFVITLRDDFTGLIHHGFMVQGIMESVNV